MSDDDTSAMEQYGIGAEQAQLLAEINAATSKPGETLEAMPPNPKVEDEGGVVVYRRASSSLSRIYTHHHNHQMLRERQSLRLPS